MKFFPLLWTSLWRKKARTIFTLLSITVAFVLFGLLQGVNAWLNTFGTGSNANRLYVASRVSEIQPLPSAYLRQIEGVAGIRQATYIAGITGYFQEKNNSLVALATDVKTFFALYPEWQIAPGQLAAMSRTRDGAIVAAPLMRTFGWKIGDRIPLRTSVMKQDGSADWDFEIVGSYDVPSTPAEANRILVNYAYFDEARRLERGTAWAFVVAVDDPARSAQICAAVDALFVNSAFETVTQDEKAYVQGQLRQLGDVSLMANAIVAAVLFTLLFLTGNTMMQSVRERTPELAILKTVGFSDRSVTVLVLIESVLLCVLAASLGLAAAAAVFPVTAALGIGGAALPLKVIAAGLAMAVVLALVSGLPPAWRAQRLVIVDALAGR
ncbi:MAG TPA: FtsX-like permease family protein [Steroidobacteraceae bacterium]|jgi:putative ABC transport system permease protein|nr:FtsX-like permease family protein [Steroidobacteraceae bacterium]